MIEKINEDAIRELLEKKDFIKLKEELSEMNEVDLAEFLDEIDNQDMLVLFRLLPKDLAADVFANFSKETQRDIINTITDSEVKGIIDEMFFDDYVDLLEEMPANVAKRVLKNSSEAERSLINEFLQYPKDSAGSIMTIEFVSLKEYHTVKEALEHIRKIGLTKETIYNSYVTDASKRLMGIVSLRTLVTSRSDKSIAEIMERDVISVETHDDREKVAQIFQKYGFLTLPVVDRENRLIGIITVDDIMDVMEDEATEDFQKMAGMTPSDTEYLDTSVLKMAKHRLGWLLFLMISATFTGNIIAGFEHVLSKIIVLNMFIPMIMGTGGNSGSQSSTLVIRGLATGELELRDVGKIVSKELRVSLMVGLALAVVCFFKLLLVDRVRALIALTVSMTLIVTVIMAKLIGGVLPIAAKKIHLDPAIMAAPLITTIVDAASLICYFSVAKVLLKI